VKALNFKRVKRNRRKFLTARSSSSFEESSPTGFELYLQTENLCRKRNKVKVWEISGSIDSVFAITTVCTIWDPKSTLPSDDRGCFSGGSDLGEKNSIESHEEIVSIEIINATTVGSHCPRNNLSF